MLVRLTGMLFNCFIDRMLKLFAETGSTPVKLMTSTLISLFPIARKLAVVAKVWVYVAPGATVAETVSSTHEPPPSREYRILKLVTFTSSRFFILALTWVVAVSAVDVNNLPDRGAIIESSKRSLSEIEPAHVPVFGT